MLQALRRGRPYDWVHRAEDRTYSLEASDRAGCNALRCLHGVTVQDNGSILAKKRQSNDREKANLVLRSH